VVLDHFLAEVLDVLVFGLLGREVAGLDLEHLAHRNLVHELLGGNGFGEGGRARQDGKVSASAAAKAVCFSVVLLFAFWVPRGSSRYAFCPVPTGNGAARFHRSAALRAAQTLSRL